MNYLTRRPYASGGEYCQKILHPAYHEDVLGHSEESLHGGGYGRCARKTNHLGSHTQYEPLATLLDALGREETIEDLIVFMRAQNPVIDDKCRCIACVMSLPS